jgi:DDE_Tnp_1-associated
VSSLVEALAEVLDPREARGVRHGVLAVLLLGECAGLTGARSFAAVAEYAHDAGRLVLAALGVGEVVRHESTLRRVLQKVDATALGAALRSWAMAQLDTPNPHRLIRRVANGAGCWHWTERRCAAPGSAGCSRC